MERITITLNENEFDKLMEYLRSIRGYYYDWYKHTEQDEDKSLIKEAEKDLEEIDNLMDLLGKSNKQESENE